MRFFVFLVAATVSGIEGFLAVTSTTPISPIAVSRVSLQLSDHESQGDDIPGPEKSLLQLLLPSKTCKVDQMSGTDLGK